MKSDMFLSRCFAWADRDAKGFLVAHDLKCGVAAALGVRPSKVRLYSESIGPLRQRTKSARMKLLLAQMFCGCAVPGHELRVTRDEFVSVMKARLTRTDLLEDVRRLFKALDLRAEGFISLRSFQQACEMALPLANHETMIRAFHEADRDGDGRRRPVGSRADRLVRTRIDGLPRQPKQRRPARSDQVSTVRGAAKTRERQCADCGAATPKWATVTHGGFICTQCAGPTMDKGGNVKLNKQLERTLALQLKLNDQTPKKPEAQSPRAERELFIRAKYDEKMFSGGVANSPPKSPSRRSPTKTAATSQGMVEYTGVVVIDLKEAKDLAEIELYDYNKVNADRPMGAFAISAEQLSSLPEAGDSDGPYEDWYPVIMPRDWATNFSEHMVAGAEGVTKGIYRVSLGFKDPIKGARENGLEGFAKGVGTGVAGVVYRPIKVLARCASSENDGSSSPDSRDYVAAGSVRIALSLQKFS
ncbi:EF-hand domain pair [Phytophthora cactorum]|nr:EF-hand domain pair [Phytophthora cactorum]